MGTIRTDIHRGMMHITIKKILLIVLILTIIKENWDIKMFMVKVIFNQFDRNLLFMFVMIPNPLLMSNLLLV